MVGTRAFKLRTEHHQLYVLPRSLLKQIDKPTEDLLTRCRAVYRANLGGRDFQLAYHGVDE